MIRFVNGDLACCGEAALFIVELRVLSLDAVKNASLLLHQESLLVELLLFLNQQAAQCMRLDEIESNSQQSIKQKRLHATILG